MNNYLNFLKKSDFNKNVFSLFKGVFIAQIIGVIGSVFLAKIYAPNLYGYYSVFLSFVGILSVLNSMKLEYIIITDKSAQKSTNVLSILIIIILIISLLHLSFFIFLQNFFIGKGIALSILILSVLTAFFLSNSNVYESHLTRNSSFKTISNAKVIMTSATILFQFLLFSFFKEGLIYGYLCSTIIIFFYYLNTSKSFVHFPNLNLFKSTLQSHINLLKFGFPSGLVNAIAINVMPIFILSYFSAASSGVYALSLKIVSVPLFILSASVSQVYFQKASHLFNHSKAELYNFTKEVVFINILTMSIVLILINTVGIYFLNLFFDHNWVNLNLYIFILSFFILGQVTFSPISSIIVITNKMQIGLIFNISLLIINFISIYIGYLNNNILFTLILLTIFGGLGYIVLLLYFLSLLKLYKNDN